MKEMVESNVLQLTEKHLVTNHISLFIGYSKNCIKPSRGSRKITNTTNSYRILLEEFKLLYKKIINPNYPIRQIGISFGNVKDEIYEQFDLFADQEDIEKEKRVQEALVLVLCQEKVPVKMRNIDSFTQLPVHCIDFFL